MEVNANSTLETNTVNAHMVGRVNIAINGQNVTKTVPKVTAAGVVTIWFV